MNLLCLGLLICVSFVSAQNHEDSEIERWFNGFYGPSVFFDSHAKLGQHGHGDHHQEHDGHRHRQYVNLEWCECDEIIEDEPIRQASTITASTAAATTAAATTTTPTRAYETTTGWQGAGKRFIDLDALVAEDGERHVLDFHGDGGHHQHGGYFENHHDDDGSSESSSEEEHEETHVKPHHHHDSHKFVPEPTSFVAPADYVSNAEDQFVHYRRQPGFRNPYTGECVCSRGTQPSESTTPEATTTAAATTSTPA